MVHRGRLLVIVLTWIMSSSPVIADKPAPPYSFKAVTANGEYVFVMIADVGRLFSQTTNVLAWGVRP